MIEQHFLKCRKNHSVFSAAENMSQQKVWIQSIRENMSLQYP